MLAHEIDERRGDRFRGIGLRLVPGALYRDFPGAEDLAWNEASASGRSRYSDPISTMLFTPSGASTATHAATLPPGRSSSGGRSGAPIPGAGAAHPPCSLPYPFRGNSSGAQA